MSFTPISKIIKAYERKKELQAKREENNQIKKLSQVAKLLFYTEKVKNLQMLKLT